MLKKLCLTIAPGIVLAGLATGLASPAQAQFGIEVSPRGPRVYDDRPTIVERRRRIVEEPIVERRVIRRPARECRVVVDRRVNRFGERVVRRTRVCD